MARKKPAKKKISPGKKDGRPPIEIDWQEFDKLCFIQATLVEIAGWYGCSEDTIERKVKQRTGLTFADYWRQKAAGGKISLRRSQYQKAIQGNPTMLIWLGKQWLDQSDKQEVEQTGAGTFVFVEESNDTAN